MNIMAVLIHSFGEVLHSVEQGPQGLLTGQGLPEGSQEAAPQQCKMPHPENTDEPLSVHLLLLPRIGSAPGVRWMP